MCIAPNSCDQMGLKLSDGKYFFSINVCFSLFSTESGLMETMPFFYIKMMTLLQLFLKNKVSMSDL